MSEAVALTRRQMLGLGLGAGLGLAGPALAQRGGPAPALALNQPALRAARPTQAVLQALARAGQRLVAAGERGLVIYSDDAGQSWTQARVPVSVTLTALRFADARQGWAVGHMGVVLSTEDGGASWTRRLDGLSGAALALQTARGQGGDTAIEEAQRLVDEGADKPLLDIALRGDGSLLAVGAYGLAFRSADGGRSWQSQMHRLPNPEGLSYYGLAERRGECLLFGEQGLLLRASSSQDPFAAQASPATGSLFGALSLREGPLLLLGLRGRLWRSADNGEPWSTVLSHVDAALVAGTQLSDGRVLLAGAAGQLLLSHDGGQHFRPIALRQRFPFTSLVQAADGTLLLAGMRGLQRLSPAELKAALDATPSLIPSRKPHA